MRIVFLQVGGSTQVLDMPKGTTVADAQARVGLPSNFPWQWRLEHRDAQASDVLEDGMILTAFSQGPSQIVSTEGEILASLPETPRSRTYPLVRVLELA